MRLVRKTLLYYYTYLIPLRTSTLVILSLLNSLVTCVFILAPTPQSVMQPPTEGARIPTGVHCLA